MYLPLFIFTYFTYICLTLPTFTYLCLPLLTFTYLYLTLTTFTYFYLPLTIFIYLYLHSPTLVYTDAIHNFKWVKIIQIWQNGGKLFSNIADWCHILSLTCLKDGTKCANKNKNPNICDTGGKGLKIVLDSTRPTSYLDK